MGQVNGLSADEKSDWERDGYLIREGVFTAGTTDWSHGLRGDEHVAQMTRNVLDQLGR